MAGRTAATGHCEIQIRPPRVEVGQYPNFRRVAFSRQSESERVPVPRKRVRAAVDPHRLTALAWTLIGHARGARGRRRDLAACLVALRRRRAFAGSRLSRHCEGRHDQQRRHK
jgi:hypothetical protein